MPGATKLRRKPALIPSKDAPPRPALELDRRARHHASSRPSRPCCRHFVSHYGLSKGAAGVLSASYAAGVLAASVPGGLAASRFGPKQAALGGVALTAVASLAFAPRTTSGCWAPPGCCRESAARSRGRAPWPGSSPRPRARRRGALIGATMGAAVFGALLGPVLGAVATVAGVRATFVGVERARDRARRLGARDAGSATAASAALRAAARRPAACSVGSGYSSCRRFCSGAGRARALDAARRRLGRCRHRRRLPATAASRGGAEPTARPLHRHARPASCRSASRSSARSSSRSPSRWQTRLRSSPRWCVVGRSRPTAPSTPRGWRC